MAAIALLFVVCLPPVAKAAPEGPASIVFSNGGRLFKADADGSNREVIFGKGRNPVDDGTGASQPAVSPDGSKIAFTFRRGDSYFSFSDVWTVNSDGTSAKRILKSSRNTRYTDPTFTPAGDLVVAYFKKRGRRAEAGLLQLSDDGTPGKKLMVDRQRRGRFADWDFIVDPDFSPDGKKILYGSTWDESSAYWSRLMVLNRETGKSRMLVRTARDGSWSPDGSRIVYTALTWDESVEVCGSANPLCFDGGHLEVIKADGKGTSEVVDTGGDQRSASWSRDGRIVFQSAGNVPNATEAYELFSVKPDGACLTMLTNGAPASITPTWDDSGSRSTAPGECGAAAPDPVLEVRKPTPKGALRDMFWAGLRADNRLYTSIDYENRAPYLYYGDCAARNASNCSKPFWMTEFSLCWANSLLSIVGGEVDRRQRGVPVYNQTGYELGQMTFLVTGRFMILIVGGSKNGVKEVDALRRLSQEQAAGDLPKPLLPAGQVNRMRKVERDFKLTGSISRTARRLGMSKENVTSYLAASHAIKDFGEYGTMNCAKRGEANSLDR